MPLKSELASDRPGHSLILSPRLQKATAIEPWPADLRRDRGLLRLPRLLKVPKDRRSEHVASISPTESVTRSVGRSVGPFPLRPCFSVNNGSNYPHAAAEAGRPAGRPTRESPKKCMI